MHDVNTNRILGELLKDARKRKGKKQVDVAACMGIDYQVLSDYENGRRSPGLDWLIRACECIDVDTGELVNEYIRRRKESTG